MKQKKQGRPAKTERNKKMAKMEANGVSRKEIAQHFGLTYGRVHQILGPIKDKSVKPVVKTRKPMKVVHVTTPMSLTARIKNALRINI